MCNLPRATVFSYIVEHARRYGLSTVEMNDKEEKPEHVLISTSAEKTQYDVSLLVKLGPTVEGNVLSMKFFVVMTHRRELFPKMKPESRHRKISSGFSGEAGTHVKAHDLLQVVNKHDQCCAAPSHRIEFNQKSDSRENLSPFSLMRMSENTPSIRHIDAILASSPGTFDL